jgi:hypothetical protein
VAKKKSPNNVINDPTLTLQKFDLVDLEQFTQEKSFSNNASKDWHLFFVGRDDVHELLKFVLSRVSVSLYLNMFGYDDDELNSIIIQLCGDPTVMVMITLDKSQAGGKHEKQLLDADFAKDPAAFNTHIVSGVQMQQIVKGQSATRQISHTKGFVADGKVGGEGSTNWSNSGEGTFVVKGAPGGVGFKAQNNTQSIFVDPDTISRFQTELVTEHMTALTLLSQTAQPAASAARRRAGHPAP